MAKFQQRSDEAQAKSTNSSGNPTGDQAAQQLERHGLLPIVTPLTWDTVHIPFDEPQGTLDDYVQELFAELKMTAVIHGGKLDVTQEQLRNYIRTLIKARVGVVTRTTPWKDERFRRHGAFVIPAFISLYLEKIGLTKDELLGVELVPTFESQEPMKYEDFQKVESILRRFRNYGFEYATVLPRERSGSWDMMVIQTVNDQMVSHNGAQHAVNALLASLVANTVLAAVLMPKCSYGYTDRMRSGVRMFARFKQ